MSENIDLHYMQKAIQLALKAASFNEVPVGAILVLDDQIIGEGYNAPISLQDPTAHAEIMALRAASKKIGNYRLLNTTLYVTLEPCMMCAGALVHARIKRLIYGAKDLKAGVITTQLQLLDQPFLNHKVEHVGGLLSDPCKALLSQFFAARR